MARIAGLEIHNAGVTVRYFRCHYLPENDTDPAQKYLRIRQPERPDFIPGRCARYVADRLHF